MKNVMFGLVVVLGLGSLLLSSYTTEPVIETKAEKVQWYSIEDAMELNKKEPRKIMIDIYATWCGPCKLMDKRVFGDPAVAKYLNENFYPVKFDGEYKEVIEYEGQEYKFIQNGKSGIHELALALTNGRPVYPTVVFMSEEKEVINRVTGVQPKDMFELYLEYLYTDSYQEQDWFEYSGQK